ncbi:hypothetical protein M5K25_010963 [Dendrobium thyrsiflorum]|uniref:Retrovirus-related Pol polyprotein from transposon TNT 1-94 n=1 Tax=Dendrobium thyrsiflorum TaxID=117978 RepID=A0ABD0V1Z0_DENTH
MSSQCSLLLIWRSQVLNVIRANSFEGYLDGTVRRPPRQITSETGTVIPNPLFSTWMLIDQNLAAALFTTISAPLLPYVLNLDSCSEIWQTIGKRLQASNRSRILQLKNDLNYISMANKTMQQYLTEIKMKVDTLTAGGRTLDSEDVIIEETNLENEVARALHSAQLSEASVALTATSSRGSSRQPNQVF